MLAMAIDVSQKKKKKDIGFRASLLNFLRLVEHDVEVFIKLPGLT